MKQYLHLIQSKLRHASCFESYIARKEKLLQILESKKKQWFHAHLALIAIATVIPLVCAVQGFMGLALLFCIVLGIATVSMCAASDKNYAFATRKERRALELLEQDFFDELTHDHTIMQDWVQLVVDQKTEDIFIDLVKDITEGRKSMVYDKMVRLLNNYTQAQLQNDTRLKNQKALDAMGLKLPGEIINHCHTSQASTPPHSYLADKEKLLALL